MPVPDGQREKKETGAAAGIARCLRPAASPERRRRRKAKGPARGRAGAGQPLPGRREVERAGGRRRVQPCAGPPARPSSRRRGSAGPMRKCSPGQSRPAPPLARYFLLGVGRGAPSPDAAARARATWQLPLRAPRPNPGCLRPRSPQGAGGPFLEGGLPSPSLTARRPESPSLQSAPGERGSACWDFGRRGAGGAEPPAI